MPEILKINSRDNSVCEQQVSAWNVRHSLPSCLLMCSDFDPCRSDPCKNGATCSKSGNDYSCSCVKDYGGDDCGSKLHSLCRVVSCRVVSCRVVSCRVVSCRVVSCRVVSCRVVSCRVVSCRVVSCRVVSCRVVSCRVVSCRVVSCRVVSCRAVPCRAVPCRAVPCRAVPCRVVSSRVESLFILRYAKGTCCLIMMHRIVIYVDVVFVFRIVQLVSAWLFTSSIRPVYEQSMPAQEQVRCCQ